LASTTDIETAKPPRQRLECLSLGIGLTLLAAAAPES
jgi:hypothetical protein